MLPTIALAVALAAQPPDSEPEPEPEAFETSVPLMSDDEAWRQPGFRVSLGYALDGVIGLEGTPGGLLHTAILEVGVRLDDQWSLFATLRYGARIGDEPILRYAGTIEPTFHIFDALTISAGVGIAGFVLPDTGASTPEPPGGLIAPYTLTETSPLIGSCDGVGVIGVARVAYAFVLSSVMSTGPALQIDGQYTGCSQALNRSNPDTGEQISLRQFWTHLGVSVAWRFSWR